MNTEDLKYFDEKFDKVKSHTTAEIERHIANPCKNSAGVKQELADHKEKDHKGLTLWGIIGTVMIFVGALAALVIGLVGFFRSK